MDNNKFELVSGIIKGKEEVIKKRCIKKFNQIRFDRVSKIINQSK